MKHTRAIISYTCDLCGGNDGTEFISQDNPHIEIMCHPGDRDVSPSYINPKYTGCSIPYSSTAPKDVCMTCFLKYLRKYLEEMNETQRGH